MSQDSNNRQTSSSTSSTSRPEPKNVEQSKERTEQNTSDLSPDAKAHPTTTTTATTTNKESPSTAKTASTNPNLKPATTTGSSAAMAKKEQPEPPAFEKGIIENLTVQFGDKVKVVYIKPLRMKILVNSHDVVEVATFIRDKLGFDHAESVGGTDYPKDNQIEVIYHLGSYSRQELEGHILAIATRTPREDARLPTLINVFRSVEYHERETFEMLGVYFEGHPRNDRFLLPEDWADIPPLRKEFRIKGR
jgi:NADH:ubiquinone oxidoreductase subunit C